MKRADACSKKRTRCGKSSLTEWRICGQVLLWSSRPFSKSAFTSIIRSHKNPTHAHTHTRRSYCFPYLNHWHKSSWREETTERMNDINPHTVPKQCWDVQLIIMGNLPEHDLLWKMSSCLPLNLNRRCTQQHKSRMKKHSGWSVLKRLPPAPLRDVIVVYLHRKELQNPSPKSAN